MASFSSSRFLLANSNSLSKARRFSRFHGVREYKPGLPVQLSCCIIAHYTVDMLGVVPGPYRSWH